jgi:hypothetical protein
MTNHSREQPVIPVPADRADNDSKANASATSTDEFGNIWSVNVSCGVSINVCSTSHSCRAATPSFNEGYVAWNQAACRRELQRLASEINALSGTARRTLGTGRFRCPSSAKASSATIHRSLRQFV